ncbi:MAG: hypothetical protein PHF67_00585 [Candidatus Nanoarchaeia archaeon]|nr:hypothetical protein [Candidatus Nanoarchaeia archaeon]
MKKEIVRAVSAATLSLGLLVGPANSQPPMEMVPQGVWGGQVCDSCFSPPVYYGCGPAHFRGVGPIRGFFRNISAFFSELSNLGCHRGGYGYGLGGYGYGYAQPFFSAPMYNYGFQDPCCGGLETGAIYDNGQEIIPTPQPTPAPANERGTVPAPPTPSGTQLQTLPLTPPNSIPKTIIPDKVAQVSYRPISPAEHRPNSNYNDGGIVVSEASASGHKAYYVIPAPKIERKIPADNEWHAVRE